MKIKIGTIAQIFSGYNFRKSIDSMPNGKTFVIQAKDLVGETVALINALPKVDDEMTAKYLLRDGDVLLAARGMMTSPFRSAVFRSNNPNVVASSSVHVIRLSSTEFLPEFVALFLNSMPGQHQLGSIVTGSYLGAISRSKLGEIWVPKIPLQKQRALVNLDYCFKEEIIIFQRRNQIHKNIFNSILSDFSK